MGFDYRLPQLETCHDCLSTHTQTRHIVFNSQMAIADKWIETMKTRTDENWDMEDLVHTLTNRCVCVSDINCLCACVWVTLVLTISNLSCFVMKLNCVSVCVVSQAVC